MKQAPIPYRSIYSRRDRLFNLVRPLLERCHIGWLSHPALNGLDRQLERLLPRRGGWYVEAGAYDGFQQSNTYYLAKMKGWQGVLIEPLPPLAALCKKRRGESKIVCCALGAPEDSGRTLQLRHGGLMTMVRGALADDATEHARASSGLEGQGLPALEQFVEATVRTLTEVLIETDTPPDFDLLSLDVEGFEVDALRGLDLSRFIPRAICVEVRHENMSAVMTMLETHYEKPAILTKNASYADCFFAARTHCKPAAA